jgi:uncharacterized protein with PIN domain
MGRIYHHCPNCNRRMKRTGEKKVAGYYASGRALYEREYECRGCGRIWTYESFVMSFINP